MSGLPKEQPGDAMPVSFVQRMPHSPEAEKHFLGSIFAGSIDTVTDAFAKVPDAAFYLPGHRVTYAAMRELFDGMKPLDPTLLQQSMSDHGELEKIGGAGALADVFTCVPSGENWLHYAEIILGKAKRRAAISASWAILRGATDESTPVEESLEEADAMLFALQQDRSDTMRPAKQVLPEVLANIEDIYHNRGKTTLGWASGFADLDRTLLGMRKKQLVILAAMTSHGKTTLGMQIAENLCINLALPTLIITVEETAEDILQGMIGRIGEVDQKRLRDGFHSKGDLPKMKIAFDKVMGAPLYIEDGAGLTIQQIRLKVRQAKLKWGIEVVVTDYIQLIKSTTKKAQGSSFEELVEVSWACKMIAKEMDVLHICMAQFNREAAQRPNQIPKISQLRGGGALEQDADIILVLHRPNRESKDPEEFPDNVAWLSVSKQRKGPTGKIGRDLVFNQDIARFEDGKGDGGGKMYGKAYETNEDGSIDSGDGVPW